MTTEEVRLNEVLEHAGIDAVETDLGEWIQQLADEVPFHIVVPAIHKSRGQIATLFAEKIGTPRDADAEALTAAARDRLRAKFAAAGVGISGANFLIAETGSLLILENEGNVRLTTSVPRVHVALVGIEKLLPRVADLDVFLRCCRGPARGRR
jgi:L-lactate dehydrogenase complex protein LldF